MSDRGEPDPSRRQLGVQIVEPEQAVRGDVDVAELGSGFLAQQLPGHQVGVVLHLGDGHDIPFPHVLASPRVGDQVDRLGGVPGEDRRVRRAADEAGDARPRIFEQRGCLLGEGVDAAVNVGVLGSVIR